MAAQPLRWAMVFPRPRSLNGRLLLGLVVIATPLLAALVTAVLQLRRLNESSERLVNEAVQATRLAQDIFSQTASLERRIRYYQLLGDPRLVDAYRENDEGLRTIESQLRSHMRLPEALDAVTRFTALREDISSKVLAAGDEPPPFEQILGEFSRLDDAVSDISARSNKQIDGELESLRQATSLSQKRLFWGAALLVPLTTLAIFAFSLGFGRPLRQIDRAIDELGRGALFNPIRIDGPVDLERLGRQLEWLRQRLLDLAQERTRFLRHMSHELKTPLANIREGTELLMDGAVGELASDQREVTGILRENSMKLQRLIENLLSFSAWQSSSVGLDLSTFRLRPLVKQVIENQQLTLLGQRVRLDVTVDDVELHADRGKIRLILENLLSNAIKYSPRAGTILLRAQADGTDWVLDVGDSGPGIPPEERAQVFEAFYTGKAPRGHIKGTGIGLSVVLEFVTAHRGTIQIVDGECSGAHFRIRMPLRSEPLSVAATGNKGEATRAA
jgi:two-component system, NtrC family, sensor histidine kinase GlrK